MWLSVCECECVLCTWYLSVVVQMSVYHTQWRLRTTPQSDLGACRQHHYLFSCNLVHILVILVIYISIYSSNQARQPENPQREPAQAQRQHTDSQSRRDWLCDILAMRPISMTLISQRNKKRYKKVVLDTSHHSCCTSAEQYWFDRCADYCNMRRFNIYSVNTEDSEHTGCNGSQNQMI